MLYISIDVHWQCQSDLQGLKNKKISLFQQNFHLKCLNFVLMSWGRNMKKGNGIGAGRNVSPA